MVGATMIMATNNRYRLTDKTSDTGHEHIVGHQSPQREDPQREKVSSSQHREVSPNELRPRRRSLALRCRRYAVTPQNITDLVTEIG